MLLSKLVLVKHVLNTCIGISKTCINWGFNLLFKNFNHLLQFPLNKITDSGPKNGTAPSVLVCLFSHFPPYEIFWRWYVMHTKCVDVRPILNVPTIFPFQYVVSVSRVGWIKRKQETSLYRSCWYHQHVKRDAGGGSVYSNMLKGISESEWKSLSSVWLFVTPWTVTCQALLPVEFSRPEYWSG